MCVSGERRSLCDRVGRATGSRQRGRARARTRCVRFPVRVGVIALGLFLALLCLGSASAQPVTRGTDRQEPTTPGQPPAPTSAPNDVRQTADDVLARPEFQRPEPNLFDKARDWVGERIGRVLQSLTSGGGASLLGWGVMLLAIAAIVFLLARFSRTVQADPRRAAEVSVERTRTSAQWADEAERLEREGEWKLALRARF